MVLCVFFVSGTFPTFGPLLIFWITEPILNIQTDLCSAQRVLSENINYFGSSVNLKIPCGIAIWRLFVFHGHSTQEPTSNVCDNEQGDPF